MNLVVPVPLLDDAWTQVGVLDLVFGEPMCAFCTTRVAAWVGVPPRWLFVVHPESDELVACCYECADGLDGGEREDCPYGCRGRFSEGKPLYCGRNGCDVESPGRSYKKEPGTWASIVRTLRQTMRRSRRPEPTVACSTARRSTASRRRRRRRLATR